MQHPDHQVLFDTQTVQRIFVLLPIIALNFGRLDEHSFQSLPLVFNGTRCLFVRNVY